MNNVSRLQYDRSKYMTIALIGFFVCSLALVPAVADEGRLIKDTVYAKSLEDNLLGTDPNQPFQIYLPPGYDQEERHYPTIYMLNRWVRGQADEWDPITPLADALIAEGILPPVILVMPNGSNVLGHTLFANSPIVGNWTSYLANDLVQYVETHYRAMTSAASRGIFGIASGATGALEVAFNYPKVFGQVYAYSPYALHNPFALASFDGLGPESPVYQLIESHENFHTLEDWANAPSHLSPMITTFGQLWAPELNNPPLYMSHVITIKDEKVYIDFTHPYVTRPNTLLSRVPELAPKIKQLKQIGFSSGSTDFNSDPVPQKNIDALEGILSDHGVKFAFLEHDGDDSTEGMWEWGLREIVFPFMAHGFAEISSAVETKPWGKIKRESLHMGRGQSASDNN